MSDVLKRAANVIQDADALLITAGAGMGIDSGLPDFRGNEGFWKAYPPYRKLGKGFIEMANPAGFASDPAFAWGFYGHRLNLYRETAPHSGFQLLGNWSSEKRGGSFVMTSNVDGHFQRAGFDGGAIYEVHGSIHHLQCSVPCASAGIWKADELRIEVNEETMRAEGPLPKCSSCGAVARPNILMFGDWSYLGERNDAQRVRLERWLEKRAGERLAILEFGAGTAVPTVRHFSEEVARRFPESTLLRFNPREPEILIHGDHLSIPLGALEGLEKIESLMAEC